MVQVDDPTTAFDLLILPGRGNSGTDHWQSYWSMAFPSATRVLQDEWDSPRLTDWLPRLDQAVAQGRRPAVLIGHSLGVSLAVHWLTSRPHGRVKAAFLVAPSDVESPDHTPDVIRNFAPIPRTALGVPTTVVASTNDTFVSIERAEEFAGSWNAGFCNVGELGHINSTSRLGLWPQGLLLLGQLLGRIAV
ncbi:MAG: alpha/beta hydrolase [Bradyrhizobiaceae bacterium]|nr:MAG: alpha/beta hydrolase [Bradyrhizobiaceae bacterium]